MSNDLKWLLVSDLHIPFHNKRHVDMWLDVVRHTKPDVIDILGDLDDACPVSRFAEGTSLETSDLQVTYGHLIKKFFEDLRAIVPDAEIHFATGNHEERYDNYISKKAPALQGLITPELLWGTDKSNIMLSYYNEPPVHRYGDIFVHHGPYANIKSGESVRKVLDDFNISAVVGHCFSDDTELLTRDGWKSRIEISEGMEVYTFNRDTNLGEYQPVEEVFEYSSYKELVRIKSPIVDALITDGHGMVVSCQNPSVSPKWEETTAGEMLEMKPTDRRFIPMAALDEGVGVDLSDEDLRLLAWCMAEGERSGNSYRLSQSDAPDGRLDTLKTLFESHEIEWAPIKRYDAGSSVHGTYRNYDAYRVRIPSAKFARLDPYLNSKDKTPSRELMKMNGRQARIFLDEYVICDGYKNSAAVNSYQIASNNQDHIDALQELCVKAGYRSTQRMAKNPKRGAKSDKRVIYLTFNTKDWTCIDGESVSVEPYEGKVWCVTVPNHTLVARRNGQPFVTMNSHRQGYVAKTFPLAAREIRGWELGHLTDIKSPGMGYDLKHDWQAGFGYATIVNGVDPHINLASIRDNTCVVDGKVFKA